MIQITVFLEILISCIPRSQVIWSCQWANQPSRTPRNRNPFGWRTEGVGRLAKGMPNVSSTGLKGKRIQQRAERNADYFGLDEEMLRATERLQFALEEPPGPRKTATEALKSQGVLVFLQPSVGWQRIVSPPKPERPSVTGWDALNDKPNCLNPLHFPRSRVPR